MGCYDCAHYMGNKHCEAFGVDEIPGVIFEPVNTGGLTMREITRHEQNEANKQIKIHVVDEPGPGGANHSYKVTIPHWVNEAGPVVVVMLDFQNGAIQEVGVNGLTHEVLLAILIDRLEAFQRGPYKCAENGAALESLESSLRWLHQRTRKREERGVEGTMGV